MGSFVLFILLTLAFGYVLVGLASALPALGSTYGFIQINNAPHELNFFSWTMNKPSDWLIPLFVMLIITFLVCWRMGESAYGRVLKGIREDPVATRSLGKNTLDLSRLFCSFLRSAPNKRAAWRARPRSRTCSSRST